DVVATSTQHMSDDDLHAVATYLQSLPPRTPPVEAPQLFNAKAIVQQGEKVYARHCAGCHGKDGSGVAGVYPPLAQQLSDSEVSAVVSYMRRSWTNNASVVRPEDVSKFRHTPID